MYAQGISNSISVSHHCSFEWNDDINQFDDEIVRDQFFTSVIDEYVKLRPKLCKNNLDLVPVNGTQLKSLSQLILKKLHKKEEFFSQIWRKM